MFAFVKEPTFAFTFGSVVAQAPAAEVMSPVSAGIPAHVRLNAGENIPLLIVGELSVGEVCSTVAPVPVVPELPVVCGQDIKYWIAEVLEVDGAI